MNRAQILWLECWIALSGGVFWSLAPRLHHWNYVLIISGVWAFLCFAAIWIDALETWAHRMSSFVGFLLFTVEGMLGLLGLTGRSGMLLIALLHGCTFFLSIAGRYQARNRSRRRPSLEALTQQILDKAKKDD